MLQIHLSGGEPTARQATLWRRHRPCVESRALHQPHHPGRRGEARGSPRTRRSPASTMSQLSFQGVDQETKKIGALQGPWKKRDFAAWVIERGLPLTINALIHRAQHASRSRRYHRSRGRTRRAAARNRPCAILRLGAAQPRGADADLRGGRRIDCAGRGGARPPEGRTHHRHGGARLLRASIRNPAWGDGARAS